MKDSTDNTTENLVGCGVGLLLVPFMTALRGWVLATLWTWLMVPIFGFARLTVWQAIGVSLIVGVFTMKMPRDDDDNALQSVIKIVIYSVVSYAFALLLGWVVAHQI